MILDGKIGRVTHVDLNWYIDIKHGSSYFNRWNRMRENSGSLSIHKSSHHFDLVSWWVDGIPEYVHAFGGLNHYGPEGEFNPSKKDGRHCGECSERTRCAYKRRWETRNSSIFAADDHINAYETKIKQFTTYRPDMCIFDSEINIQDTFVVNVKYRNGVLLNYSANFSTPYEGYRLAINGTRGRLETLEFNNRGVLAMPDPNDGDQYIDYFPLFGGRERINVISSEGGHGGGDPLLLEDIFLGEDPDRKFNILAKSVDGLRAISVGDAVFNSIQDGKVQDLTDFIC
jgi:predicted dehydrogenase